MRRTKGVIATILVSSFFSPALADTPSSGTWKEVEDSDGIRVMRLEVPGSDFPGFRGEAVIAADVDAIVAVLQRVDEHPRWMHRCTESQVIEELGAEHLLIYNRTDSPWPVWDRDVILDTVWTREAGNKLVRLSFNNADPKRRALPEHVVRMPRLQGFYELRQTAPGRTNVIYQVEVDIGGSVPSFIAERVARDMPYETLQRLRARTKTGQGR